MRFVDSTARIIMLVSTPDSMSFGHYGQNKKKELKIYQNVWTVGVSANRTFNGSFSCQFFKFWSKYSWKLSTSVLPRRSKTIYIYIHIYIYCFRADFVGFILDFRLLHLVDYLGRISPKHLERDFFMWSSGIFDFEF